MSETNKKYQKILKELKENIKDEKQLEYVNKKFAEVSIIFLDMIDEISENFETRLHELEEQQVFVEGKLKNIQSVVKNIESDIYDEDSNFEILCPYCNNEFSANVEDDSQKEVKCPECNNIIELDWNDESDDCGCSACHCDDEDCDCEDCDCEDDDDCDCEDCNCGTNHNCNSEECTCGDDCKCDDDCDCKKNHKEDEE